MSFKILNQEGYARRGILKTRTYKVNTPVFMPVGTYGAVKAVTPDQLKDIGFEIILGNAFHLEQRPGSKTIKDLSGLHNFMNWDRSILTDSGGFQVWSLGKLRKLFSDRVEFKSPLDGKKITMTPADSIQIQLNLNSDILMAFDDCTAYPSNINDTKKSMALTHQWALESKKYFDLHKKDNLLFGIVQGGEYIDLRLKSLNYISSLNFDGIAIGGLSVGEPREKKSEILKSLAPVLPNDIPHYVMGVGTPEELVEGVRYGIDMFDCVIPTRNGRNGYIYTDTGIVKVRNSIHKSSDKPISDTCECYACKNYSIGYIHHLDRCNEMLASTLMTICNLSHFHKLMKDIRNSIEKNKFEDFVEYFYDMRSLKKPNL